MPAQPDVPGLAMIEAAAASLGIDLGDTPAKARTMFRAQPEVLRTGAQTLAGHADRMIDELHDARAAGTDVGQSIAGEYADSFAQTHSGLLDHVATSGDIARQGVSTLRNAAAQIAGQQYSTGAISAAMGAWIHMALAAQAHAAATQGPPAP